MRTLLVDNYDSFTYNLFQLIAEVNGVEPVVVRNDAVTDPAELGLDRFDNIVISPGPGRPDSARDFGISRELIERAELPLLGVCLGHQGIVLAAGGAVVAAPHPRHGYPDRITHDDCDLFAGIPRDFLAVRYHSLCAAHPLPDDLVLTATAPDGVIMGVRHRHRPQWGVQFHPESISSEYGAALLRNFARLTREHAVRREMRRDNHLPEAPREITQPATSSAAEPMALTVLHEVVERAVDTEAVFVRMFRDSATAFWLDSAHAEPGLDRFSYLGDAAGPLAEVVRYRVGDGFVTVDSAAGGRRVAGTVFDYLAGELERRRIEFPSVPFDFVGGYVGYLGYEVKADCGAAPGHRAATPDAQWVFADRLIVVDHVADRTHLLALAEPESLAAARTWLDTTRSTLADLPDRSRPEQLALPADEAAVAAGLTRGRDRYLADIAEIDAQLRAGQTYEVNLTDATTVAADCPGLAVYRVLRRSNPAPQAAFLRFGDLEVACSSPERFLKVDRTRTVESKPIKGTAPRGATPAADENLRRALELDPKTRAENLMIVDLLRNDLGRVCEVGSVHVPKLMAAETYTTMHQLVTTVRGRLRPDVGVLDCVRACFPGGSMTGAPKLRTMEIIDTLETEARGIYSGAIGFLGLGGTAELNIVIRTAVRHDGRWRIGAGGAVVLDSDAESEYHEMVLKAAAALRAVVAVARPSVSGAPGIVRSL
ncbi:aminodeoxychorismate synthase component I [Nocardia terpenica]|uniref:aminodeoxychorismate synthase component I n=1 Tax=Nocardia terpenica TaxID=455432 RepID=UPI0018960333|nr:aminodeoxychorismate synthase component I [Nocardia terpenica]MBF6065465.1 aminodeoxychorismate synthase component I [Nocardia terpenica]MBF6109147.1 aminodeoxychorismate synthase component I [Nocardia terpenica]MBF6114651.1 aminodeoxychorismate synthase component I [Nocardia terpenica]MBF6123336.1 aminodeoxychorismate synthase component I [Nocardia terpenica]MBF6156646.1 aminodeoxychorismate synthase component I [Nocardia terpenica]